MRCLLSGKVARAFDLNREDPRLRDRYGRHMFGQSLLLARRLVAAGVPVVQVNMGRVQKWDTHSANFKSLKDRLLPPLDRGVAALLDDLKLQGLLDETLVIVTGEFGRTPASARARATSIPATAATTGRPSSPRSLPAQAFAAGRRSAQSDRIGAYPASRPYHAGRLCRHHLPLARASTPHTSCATGWDGRSGFPMVKRFRRFMVDC